MSQELSIGKCIDCFAWDGEICENKNSPRYNKMVTDAQGCQKCVLEDEHVTITDSDIRGNVRDISDNRTGMEEKQDAPTTNSLLQGLRHRH